GSDRSGAATSAPASSGGPGGAASGESGVAKTASPAPTQATGRSARTFAIFTRLLASDLPASSTARLEEEITACLSGQGVSVVSRADLINGVARFAGDGPNTGSPESQSQVVEQALSEQASAVRLAELLGADTILVASITNYTIDDRAFDDPSLGVRSNVRTYTLGVTLRVVDGATGGSIYGGSADASESIRRTSELTQDVDPIDDLLQEASRNVCRRSGDAIRALPAPTVVDAGDVEVSIALVASGLEVPDIVADPDGRFTVASARLPISLVGARVLVDGVLAGTAPGNLGISSGLHRLTIEHPLFTPLQQVVNVRPGLDGQQLRFAMNLSESGRRQWVQNIEVLEALKDGEVLRESQLTAVRAFAEFLRNSNVRIDTSQVRNLNVGGRSIWAQLLGE
ncbi:MAG: PEGA domain-containing protein, partial [Planctomycetota bacterium]|nr:PEGA domain-containing protein [Planctomycetota bacterium]